MLPGLNLPGTDHFPGPPSHLENRVGPRSLPNSGQPGPPPPSARAQPSSVQVRAQLCSSAPLRSGWAAPRAPRKRPFKAGCSRLQTLPTPHRRPARRIPTGLDGLRPLTRGRALTLSSRRRGDAYPFAATGTRGLWPGSPSSVPMVSPKPRPRGPGELGTHRVSGYRAQVAKVGLKAVFPPGGSGCAVVTRLGYFRA